MYKRQLNSFDWNQAKAFLATAEEGSLSAAAKVTGLTQPTLSRQVAALEEELGVMLFERVGRSLHITEQGLDMLEYIKTMDDAAKQVLLSASGRSESIEGQVCISVTDGTAVNQMPAVIEELRYLAPEIEIELLCSNSISDIRRREADIAIRHVRPDQPELITRLIYESKIYLSASTEYLAEIGRPKSLEDLNNLDFIGFENIDRNIDFLNNFGLSLKRKNFKITSNNGLAVFELVKRGLGVSMMPQELINKSPGLEIVTPEIIQFKIPYWLTTHRELHLSRRIRLVYDLLAETIPKQLQEYSQTET